MSSIVNRAKSGIDTVGSKVGGLMDSLPVIGDYRSKEMRREADKRLREMLFSGMRSEYALLSQSNKILEVAEVLTRERLVERVRDDIGPRFQAGTSIAEAARMVQDGEIHSGREETVSVNGT